MTDTTTTPPDGPRPEPLRVAGSWAALVTLAGSLLTMCAAFGLQASPAQQRAILGALVAAGPIVTAVIAWRRGRTHVTPVTDPRDDHGRPLVALTASERAGVERMRQENTQTRLRAAAAYVATPPPLGDQLDHLAPLRAAIDRSLVGEHKVGLHRGRPVDDCPSCRDVGRQSTKADRP